MSYDAQDNAFDEYMQEQYDLQLRKEIAQELKASAIFEIRDTIFGISQSHRELVKEELEQSLLLLRQTTPHPDRAGAYFHAFRAVEGYIELVILRPILEALTQPVAPLFEEGKLAPFVVVNARFIQQLRDRVLKAICSSSEIADNLLTYFHRFDNLAKTRNAIFHGFWEPTDEQVHECTALATGIIETIEVQRQKFEEMPLPRRNLFGFFGFEVR